jgi:hypothetical protein
MKQDNNKEVDKEWKNIETYTNTVPYHTGLIA